MNLGIVRIFTRRQNFLNLTWAAEDLEDKDCIILTNQERPSNCESDRLDLVIQAQQRPPVLSRVYTENEYSQITDKLRLFGANSAEKNE